MHNTSDFQSLNMIKNSKFKRKKINNPILDLTRIKKEKIDYETNQLFARQLPCLKPNMNQELTKRINLKNKPEITFDLNNLKYSKSNQHETFSTSFKPSFNYKEAIKQRIQNVSHLPSVSINYNNQNIPNCLSSLQLDLPNKQHFQADSTVNYESPIVKNMKNHMQNFLIDNQYNEAIPKLPMINLNCNRNYNQCQFSAKSIPSWSENQEIPLFKNDINNQEQFIKLPISLNAVNRDNQINTYSSFSSYENQLETLEARKQNNSSAFNLIYNEKLNELSRNNDQNFQNDNFIPHLNCSNHRVTSQVSLYSNTLNNGEMLNYNFESELLSRLNAVNLKGKQSHIFLKPNVNNYVKSNKQSNHIISEVQSELINPTQTFQDIFHSSLNNLSNKQDTQFYSEMSFWLNIFKHSMTQMLPLQHNELIEPPNYSNYNPNNQFQSLDFQSNETNFLNNLRSSLLNSDDRLDSQVPLKSNIEPLINSNHDAIPDLSLGLNHAGYTDDIFQNVPDIKPNIDNNLEISNLNVLASGGEKNKPNEDSMDIIAKKMEKFPIERIKISGSNKKSEILQKRAKTLFKKANEVAIKCNCKIVVIIKNQRNYTQHCTSNEMENKITNIIETHV